MVKGKVESQNTSLRFWLQRLANMIVRGVTVHLNKHKTAYTDGRDTYIGVDGETVQKETTEKGKFYMTIGLLLHELAHILYTPFKGRGAVVDYGMVAKELILNGTFPQNVYPSENFDKEFFNKYRVLLGKLYSEFSNSVCDGYIEQRMLKDYPHWRKEIMYMRNKWYISSKTYDELKAENTSKNSMLASFTLDYSLNHDAKTYGADDDFVKAFDTLKPYIDLALSENDGTRRIKLVNDAFVKMIGVMDWTKPEENKNQNGSSDSSEGQSQSEGNNGQNQSQSQSQENSQSDQNQSQNGSSESDSQNSDGSDSNEQGDNQNGTDGQGNSDSSDDSGRDSFDSSNANDSQDGSDNSDSQSSDGSNSNSDSDSSQSDSSQGSSDGSNSSNSSNSSSDSSDNSSDSNSGNSGDSSNGNGAGDNTRPMTDEEIKEALSEMIQNICQDQSGEGDKSNVCNMTTTAPTQPSQEDSSNLNADIMLQQIEEGSNVRFGELDKGYVQYSLKKVTDDLASKLTLSLRRKLRDEKETYAKGLYVGKRLDTKRLYRADKRVMERKKYPDRPSMKVIVLMDISGSIGSGETLTEERKIAVSVLKTCNKLNIECEEYAFDTCVAPLLTEDDILSVKTGGGTNDFMAFNYALSRMKKSKSFERRMIIVLTDGCGSGHNMLEPLLKTCKSEKIGVIACGLGSDRDSIEASWNSFGAKCLDCDSDNIASELCGAIVKAYR